MTRISSLIVASALAILPVSAFAQQAGEPAKIAGPSSLTTTMPTADKTVADKTLTGGAPVSGTTVVDKAPAPTSTVPTSTAPTSTAQSTQRAKPDVKTTGHSAKTDMHGMNGAGVSHAKAGAPAKTTEPAKS